MIKRNSLVFSFTFLLSFLIIGLSVPGQNIQSDQQKKGFGIISSGLEIGWYNPELDYWKEKSPYYKTADFKGAISLNGYADFRFKGDLHGQVGVGYWQEVSSDLELDSLGYGKTNLVLTGIPLSIELCYYLRPLHFSVITPFIGAGGELLFIQHNENFEKKDSPDPQWGSTILGDVSVGFESRISDQFVVDLGIQYKFGSYNQEFNIYDDSENPQVIDVVTETISLSGPKIGITLKYLF